MIAKPRSNCQGERETTAEGFEDLLQVVKKSKTENEAHIKSHLYDIITDQHISPEEKKCLSCPYLQALESQEESDIRIRRAILIGLFSFWEVSLKELCEYYEITVKKNKSNGEATSKKNKTKKDKEKETTQYGSHDYVWSIYHERIPNNIDLIDQNLKALRNFMTHGSMGERREKLINQLIQEHPEFGVKKTCDVHLSSYEGLFNIKSIIDSTLNEVEQYLKDTHSIEYQNSKINNQTDENNT